MKVLVVAGCCLQENSSANIAHCAYIQGLIDNDCEVSLICGSNKGHEIDSNIDLSQIKNIYRFDTESFYHYLAKKKASISNSKKQNIINDTKKNHGERIKDFIKRKFRNLYGVHGPIIMWYFRAKKYKGPREFDYVISLSYPFVSHLLVNNLREKRSIIFKKWIQIWEDPWSTDLTSESNTMAIKNEELKLLKFADEVLYVSPLTLKYQMELYPSESSKMRWLPLPSFYTYNENKDIKNIAYGYFGDYNSNVRNLEPFYLMAIKNRINTYICGGSDKQFESNDFINVFPRMSLGSLKTYEDKCSIIVVLCNLYGGQIPGKIYQYASTNKIILFILDGNKEEQYEIKKYFSQFKRFIFCENTLKDIDEKIKYINANFEILNSSIVPINSFFPKNIIKELLNK